MTDIARSIDTGAAVTAILRNMADAERGPLFPVQAPRLRLGAPSNSRTRRSYSHPLERTAPAIDFLRSNGVSVSKASSTVHHGTFWNVSGHGYPLSAAQVIELATAKGFGR